MRHPPTSSLLSPLRKLLRRKADPMRLLARQAPPGLVLQRLVHVGAHLAQERHLYEALGFQDILWIEAAQAVHARLAQTLAAHQLERAEKGLPGVQHRTACALLTDREGDPAALREFSNDGMSSSIFAPTAQLKARWPDLTETGRLHSTRTRTLDGLLAELGFGDVHVLVVDVQGAELLVLKGAEATLAGVKAVVSEVSTQPLYDGGVLFPELRDFLGGHGFVAMSTPRRHGDMLFVHPQRSGIHP
jgi:FkbM family methyltransferase